jgi:hypothetical protein
MWGGKKMADEKSKSVTEYPPSRNINLVDSGSIAKVHAVVSDLASTGASGAVRIVGSASQVVEVLNSINDRVGNVSAALSIRGDVPPNE